MGILGMILGVLLPAIIGVGATWLGNRVNNNTLTGAQQEQNTFNSFEAQQHPKQEKTKQKHQSQKRQQ